MTLGGRLSDKSAAILELIAQGHGYSRIVESSDEFTYLDIFAAAREALELQEPRTEYEERIAAIKRIYPRAYDRWTRDEDNELAELHASGEPVDRIAQHLRRQPSAIRSRLEKHAFIEQSMGWER